MGKLIIVGCGPKAIAIATKAHVLSKLGWQVPEIQIIDKHGPAANWDGTNGYTDGDTILGTTPLEDLGFPYESSIDALADEEMLKFSYIAYLIDAGKYAEWVDRTLTPPSHDMLANYYKWVFQKIAAPLTVGEVTSISQDNGQWLVNYKANSGDVQIQADGLVLTGPGEPYGFEHIDIPNASQSIFSGQNIWHNIHYFKDLKNAKIAVIGGGETSAGVVTGLLKVIDKSSEIEIITRHPILFTRNENWMEVMYFSKVMDWSELTNQEKTEIIKHSDRGTFSVAAKVLLDSVYNVSTRFGNVERILDDNGKLAIDFSGDSKKRIGDYDYVVEATGFDPYSFMKLFDDKSFFNDAPLVPDEIEPDLSVKGLAPKLHLPGLSAMAQGPGFPNLSCLGLVSDRILNPYISK